MFIFFVWWTSVEPKVPAIKLKFLNNNTFVILKPLFEVQQNEVSPSPHMYTHTDD